MPALSRRKFIKVGLFSALGATAVGAGGYGYAHDIEPDMIEVVPVELTLPRLPKAFDGYKLAQISDIHMGTGMTPERLVRIVELVNEQEPDVIAITGDFVTHGEVDPLAPGLITALSQLKARDARLAILGNHDHWTSPSKVRAIIQQSGLMDMSNTVYPVQRDDSFLYFAGVDDYWERQDRLDDVLSKLPPDGGAILLAHEPDYADISAPTGYFDLQISGHSHGGQIIMPLINRPLHVPRYSWHYPIGQYQVGSMIQYTNRGVGTIYPAVRFNCRPEITVFTLRAEIAAV